MHAKPLLLDVTVHMCGVHARDCFSRVFGVHPFFRSPSPLNNVAVVAYVCFSTPKAREYTRALTAVKLDKMFAKPLVGALDGHGDGVFCSAASRRNLVQFLSGVSVAAAGLV